MGLDGPRWPNMGLDGPRWPNMDPSRRSGTSSRFLLLSTAGSKGEAQGRQEQGGRGWTSPATPRGCNLHGVCSQRAHPRRRSLAAVASAVASAVVGTAIGQQPERRRRHSAGARGPCGRRWRGARKARWQARRWRHGRQGPRPPTRVDRERGKHIPTALSARHGAERGKHIPTALGARHGATCSGLAPCPPQIHAQQRVGKRCCKCPVRTA